MFTKVDVSVTMDVPAILTKDVFLKAHVEEDHVDHTHTVTPTINVFVTQITMAIHTINVFLNINVTE